MFSKKEITARLLRDRSVYRSDRTGSAFAPANIALAKYWGKRDEELNLPVTSSLSISLGSWGTETHVSFCEGADEYKINEVTYTERDPEGLRLKEFLDLFRPEPDCHFAVHSENNIPMAAGLASSASGFAALIQALDRLFEWNLERWQLSILARLGSGSATRSLFEGFVYWYAGSLADGMDSYAERMDREWPDLRIGLLKVSDERKSKSSRSAMKQTVETSILYRNWETKVHHDLIQLMKGIEEQNMVLLGQTAESNALAMHGTMLDTWPPVLYWKPETVRVIHQIWELREEGVPVYFTMDAGPNVKALFCAEYEGILKDRFPDIIPVAPFRSDTRSKCDAL